jgi:CheY-like chemotaxis protein
MSRLKVLCVDDDEDIRDVATLSLQVDADLEVRSEYSGATALITATGWSPDVILLDVIMPAMDGPATLAHLRENTATASIPVIFMTARATPRDLVQYAKMGAIDVIPKPFDPVTLAATVRRMVGR